MKMKRFIKGMVFCIVALIVGIGFTGCASYTYGRVIRNETKAAFYNESYATIRVVTNYGTYILEPRSSLELNVPEGNWLHFDAYNVDAGEWCDQNNTEVTIYMSQKEGIVFADRWGRDDPMI